MIPNDTIIIGSLFYSSWLLALYNTTYMPKATYGQLKSNNSHFEQNRAGLEPAPTHQYSVSYL